MFMTDRIRSFVVIRVLRECIALGTLIVLVVGLHAQHANSEELDSNVIEEFALSPQRMLPIVPVTIQGKEYAFMVDTGSTVNVFDPSLAHLLTLSKLRDGGPSKFVLFECAGAVIGSAGIEMAPLAAVVKLETFRRYAKADVRGIVGMNTLRDHRIQLDFEFGLCVTEADPTGLGFAAGLRIDDIISEIDGTPAKDLPFIAVAYPLRNPSGKCLVRFQSSDGRERTVDLAAYRKKPEQNRN